MTKMGKKELILSTKPRYLKASKKEKTKILDEFCENTGYDRKYAITIFQAKCDYRRVSRDGRKPRAKKYGHDVMAVIVKIWELLDYPCGTRLKPSLMPILESMLSFGEITITDEIKEKMKTISARTLDRRLDNERQIRKLNKNRGTTRHGSLLKTSIPIRITDWDTATVGYMEIDIVSISIYPTVAVSQSVIRIGIDVLSNDPCLVVPRFLFNFLICRSLSNRLSSVRALIVFIFSLISSVIVISPKESIDSSIGIKEGLSLVPQGLSSSYQILTITAITS